MLPAVSYAKVVTLIEADFADSPIELTADTVYAYVVLAVRPISLNALVVGVPADIPSR